MEKKRKLGNRSMVLPTVLCSIMLTYHLFNGVSISIVQLYNDLMETLFPVAYIRIAVSFLYHIPALYFLVRFIRNSERLSQIHWLTLITGVLSAMSPLLEWAALGDIAENIMNGFDSTLENTGMYTAAVLHILFIILLLKLIFRNGQQTAQRERPERRVDETVFITVHSTGIISSSLGFIFCFVQLFVSIPLSFRPFIVLIYSAAFSLPYLITFIIWRITLKKGRLKIDEKEKTDIFAGSFNSLLSTAVLGFLLYISDIIVSGFPDGIQWFPFLFFAGLLVFSFSVVRKSLVF